MKIKNITVLKSLPETPLFINASDSINYSRNLDKMRKEELKLDISQIIGKEVVLFHWNNNNLILEFYNGLFLILTNKNRKLDVCISREHSIITDRDTIFRKSYLEKITVDFFPQQVADRYANKIFHNIQIGDQYAWLYFEKMPLLIFCTIQEIKESNDGYLAWCESE